MYSGQSKYSRLYLYNGNLTLAVFTFGEFESLAVVCGGRSIADACLNRPPPPSAQIFGAGLRRFCRVQIYGSLL
jgi:hypothetical protein